MAKSPPDMNFDLGQSCVLALRDKWLDLWTWGVLGEVVGMQGTGLRFCFSFRKLSNKAGSLKPKQAAIQTGELPPSGIDHVGTD